MLCLLGFFLAGLLSIVKLLLALLGVVVELSRGVVLEVVNVILSDLDVVGALLLGLLVAWAEDLRCENQGIGSDSELEANQSQDQCREARTTVVVLGGLGVLVYTDR